MKKLLIILALLITAGLVAPKFIGGVVETEYQSALGKVAENPAITINSTTFSRGWFSGEAVSDITILLHDNEVDDIHLIVKDHLSFGPVIFTDNGVKFALSYSQADINFNDLLPDEEIADFLNNSIHFTGLLTFAKDVVSTIVIDEVSKEIDGNTIFSSKAVGEFVLENNNRIYGEFNWEGLTAKTTDENFSVGKTSLILDQSLVSGDYYQGDAISAGDFTFLVSAINVNDAAGNETLLLKNVVMSAVSSINDDLMKATINYGAEEVKSAGQHFKNANLELVLDSIDVKVMQEANTLFSSISADGEEMFNEQNMGKISPLLTKLLNRDPVLNIKDLSVETPEGKIASAMQITIDKNVFDAQNLMSIIAALKADANGKAPLPFFAKLGLAPMIDMYVEQGLLVKKEQELSFKAYFAQGQLQVNGNVVPL